MNRGEQLVKNTAIVAAGRICTKMLTFLLLPFYTAILSTEEYGIVDLFQTYTSLFIPVIVFQIEDAVFRFMIEVRGDETGKRELISTTFFFAMMQCLLFSGVYILVCQWISFPNAEFLWSNTIITIFVGLFLQLTRGLGDNYSYAVGSFIIAFMTIVWNIVLVMWLRMGVNGMFLSIFLSNLMGILYLCFKENVLSYVKRNAFSTSVLKDMLAYSVPLIPNYICWWILGASDKSIVNIFLGVHGAGLLAVAQKFSTAYTTMYSVFNMTWTENATLHLKDKDSAEYFSGIIEKAFRILACLCMGVIAGTAIVFPYFVNEKFAAAYEQIPIYMLSAFLYSVIGIFSVVYVAYKKTGKIARTSFAAAFINLIVNLGLIRSIGLYAASVSSVAAYGVLLCIRYFDIQKFMKVRITKRTILATFFAMLLTFVVYYRQNTVLSIGYFIVLAGFSYYMNRRIMKNLIHIIKRYVKK